MPRARSPKTLGIALFAAGLLLGGGLAADAKAPDFVPACPQSTYGADGNMGPLFCKIDNPAALDYFFSHGNFKHLRALGADATPAQVEHAIRLDHQTGPIDCSAYQLWKWRWHWHFAFSPVQYCG